MRIAAPRVQLDEPPPRRPDQRPGPRVLDADLQGGDRAFLVVRALAGGGQLVRDDGALGAARRLVDRAPQRRDRRFVALRRPLRARRLGAAALRRSSSAHDSSSPRSDTTAELRRSVRAVGQAPALRDQQLVERRAQDVELERVLRRLVGLQGLPNAVSTAAAIADSGSGGAPWTRMSSTLTRSAPADARAQADARLEVGVAAGRRDAAR